MADGTTRPIADINIGDQVIATDPVSGTSLPKPVTRLHRNTDRELTDVQVRTSNGTSTVVETTPNHPFWDDNRQTWVNAGDLTPGTRLRVAGRGEATVESVQTRGDQREMRDLTVAHTHTYHVLADDHPVLVHNNNGAVCWVDEGGDLAAGRRGMPSGAYDYQSGVIGARSNLATRRGMAPQLEMPAVDGTTVTAKFDGIDGNEVIDRKLNPMFTDKAVDQARRQAATAAHNGFQAVWEMPTPGAVAAANRFMDFAKVSTITVRLAP